MTDLIFVCGLLLAGALLYRFWRSGRFHAEHLWRASSTMALLALILMAFVGVLVMFVQSGM